MITFPFSKGVVIDGNSLTLDGAIAIAHGAKVLLAASSRKRVEKSQKLVQSQAKESKPIYGINTGFGFFSKTKINHRQLKKLQANILKSHAAGYGPPLSVQETRLAMALRLNVLVRGYAGVRFQLCEALHRLIDAEIYPVIPEFGSVGASGDLAPLAHLALPLIGMGMVRYEGKLIAAEQALKSANLKPIELIEKEGLSLINGTQIMLAVGGLALKYALDLAVKANKVAALSYEALNASPDPLNPMIHELRQQHGQIESARQILQELQGSYLLNPKTERVQVQDPYSLRCAPQVHGASRQFLEYAKQVIEAELNAVTDNPLVFADQGKILSGGNFHGEPLALAFDTAALATSILSNISDRRLEVLLNPHLSGLPPFLAMHEGINSGYMATQYLSASLVNENKVACFPASADSIPGNVGIEDFVSMGMTSARKLRNVVRNTRVVLGLELLAAAQAVDLRKVKHLGKGTKKTYDLVRSAIPKLSTDRVLSEDINKIVEIMDKV